MKITRRQLRKIIKEEAALLPEANSSKIRQSFEDVAAELGDGEVDADDANVLNDIASALANLAADIESQRGSSSSMQAYLDHVAEFGEPTEEELGMGGGLKESRLSRKTLRRMIKEEITHFVTEADSDRDGSLDPDELRKLADDLEGDSSVTVGSITITGAEELDDADVITYNQGGRTGLEATLAKGMSYSSGGELEDDETWLKDDEIMDDRDAEELNAAYEEWLYQKQQREMGRES